MRTKAKAKPAKKAARGNDVCSIELVASYTDDIKLCITAAKRDGCIHLHIEDNNDSFDKNPYIAIGKSGKPVYHMGHTLTGPGKSIKWPEGNVLLAALARSSDYRTYLKEAVYPFFDGVINGK